MKKIALNIIRVLISLGLLLYLIYLSDVPQIIDLIKSLNPFSILLAIGAFLFSILLLSKRWHLLLNSYGIFIKYHKLFVFYLIGLFFNNFLPTTIGGDLSRAYYLAQESSARSASIGTVFLERVIGLFSTLSLAFIALFWSIEYFHSKRIVYVTVFLVILVSLFLAVVMSRRLYRRFNGIISLITFYNIGDKIIKVFDILHYYRDKKIVLAKAYFYSVSSQIAFIIMNFVLARGLGLMEISLGYLFLVVPVTFVIGLLPSINGLGVRDTGYVILLMRLGLEPSQILSLSFSVIIIPILVSVLGGIFFLFYRHQGIRAPKLSEGDV